MALTTHTCDSCGARHTCEDGELISDGWRQKGNPGRFLLMCPDCLTYYAPLWAAADKKAKKEKSK